MNKITKILLLAVSALLLIGSTFGIGAMATGGAEKPAHRIEIIANNLEYKDKISILYAVQVDGGNEKVAPSDITINFYLKQDNSTEYAFSTSKNGEKAETIKVNGEDKAVYTLTSPGLAPKYMTKVIYAQAVATIDGTEYKSEMSSFSIAEYCYKRLYNDNIDTTTELGARQVELYESVLAFGKNVQLVLGYDANNTPDTYYYVNAKDTGIVVNSATINEKAENFDHGIVKNGETLTLPEFSGTVPEGQKFAGYKVSKNGVEESDTFAAGATVTINNHAILTIDPVFESLANRGFGQYWNDTTTTFTASKKFSMSNSTVKNNLSEWYIQDSSATLDNPLDTDDNALHIERVQTSTNEVTVGFRDTNTAYAGALAGKHVAVFELDVKFDANALAAPNNTNVWNMNLYTGGTNGKSATINLGVTIEGKIRLLNVGSPFFLEQNKWYNLRWVCDIETGAWSIYVDGVLCTSGSAVSSNGTKTDVSRMELNFKSKDSSLWKLDIDNVFLGSYTKAE